MEYSFLGKKISGPFTVGSGILTTDVNILEKVAKEIPEIGIITTKSIGPVAKEGNREPIIAEYNPGSFVNAVGLTNPGAEEFSKQLFNLRIPNNKFLLISIFGSNKEDFVNIAQKLLAYADGFELNFSCPHAQGYGMAIGKTEEAIREITRAVRALGKPVIPKLTPNVPNIGSLAKAAVEGGADAITAINTVGPGSVMINQKPVLSNKIGGLSGKAIIPIGLKCVKEIRDFVGSEIPIIAMGGISTARDIENYQASGANYFGIGSALAGMDFWQLKNYFKELLLDMEYKKNNASRFLNRELGMKYFKFKVHEKIDLASDLFLLKLGVNFNVKPGQFVFLWLPEKGEKPFSVLDDEPLTFLIHKKGCFTEDLSKLKTGEEVYVRGPYGKTPNVKKKVLLVGGGSGIAALYLFAKKNECVSLIGARDKNHIAFLNEFEKFGKVYVTTQDGSLGEKGFVSDILPKILEEEKPDFCINCGPKEMITKVLEIEEKFLIKERIFSSVEFLTKCGIGLCGSCASSKGYRNCVDGTFFNSDQI